MRLHASPVQNLQMQSPLGLDLLQIAILVTGREHDQPYEWSLHELQALSVSLDPAVIDVIRRNQPVTKLGKKEAAIIQVGREIFRTHKLGSDTYARALRVLGKTGLVDSVALMADYARRLRDADRLQSANAAGLQAVSAAAFHATQRHPSGLEKPSSADSEQSCQPWSALQPSNDARGHRARPDTDDMAAD